MNEATTQPERHRDLFTSEEAAAYLHLDSVRSLEVCRRDYGLVGFTGVGKGYMYWREDLDNCALRIVGRDRVWESNGRGLRIAGGGRK